MIFLNKVFFKRLLTLRFIFGVLLLSLFLASYWQWLSYQRFLITPINLHSEEIVNDLTTETNLTNSNNFTINIKKGESINSLTKQWAQQGLISNKYYLRLFYNLNPQYKKIKAGEYKLLNDETPVSLLTKLTEGKVIQYAFTIIDGMNSFEVMNLINKNQFIQNDLQQSSISISELLEIPLINSIEITQLNFDPSIEGWLYPDTYYFSKQEYASKLLKRSVTKMKSILEEEWQNRADNLPYQSSYEALIMASIIEKETGITSEREHIAGVFVRRLQKKMKLGTDPTVIYGIGPEFNGDITFKDLRTKTPYNTYLIKGLPPTPISMPGRGSIHAALHPAEGETLYFVADGSGGHYFSKSLEEHNQAVKRYLKLNKSKN